MTPCQNCDAPVSTVDEHEVYDPDIDRVGYTCTAHDWRGEAIASRDLLRECSDAFADDGMHPSLRRSIDALLSDHAPAKESDK